MKNTLQKILILMTIISLPTIVFGWGSSRSQNDNTHKRVARQAAKLLAINLDEYSEIKKASEILLQHMDELLEGSEAPDYNDQSPYYIGADLICKSLWFNCRASGLFNDHFYNAGTGESLNLSALTSFHFSTNWPLDDQPPENAESQTRRYVGIALSKWKEASLEAELGHKEKAENLFAEAVYWLGFATHYYSDIFEPHHASNYPWSPFNQSHSQFEKLVDQNLERFLPEDEVTQRHFDFESTTDYISLTNFITDQSNKYAKMAKSFLNDCVHRFFRFRLPRSWPNAADTMARTNRDALTELYYRFFYQTLLDETRIDYDNFPVQEFNLEIKMGKGYVPGIRERHPSENVYLEIEFLNGHVETWILDTYNFYRWYAFSNNAETSYFLTWTEDLPNPSEVSSIRLVRGNNSKGSNWVVDKLQIFIHGIRVLNTIQPMELRSGSEISIDLENGLHFN